jgi:O-antigen/teichoic acid export membrane protein
MALLTWVSFPSSQRVLALRNSPPFRRSAENAAYSLADYVAQPAAMLAAAPFLVHHLGLQQYGVWMLVSAMLSGVGILSAGFGDATVKYVSAYRARNDSAGIERTIRATLTINMVLGLLVGGLVWVLASAITHVFRIEVEFQAATIRAVQISAVILPLRAIESVFVSTLRAFEHYGPAVKLNILLRIGVIISALIVSAKGHGVDTIMLATLLCSGVVVILQAIAARRTAGCFKLLPTLEWAALSEVFSFGCFSWLQGLAGVGFSYADRFLVGMMLGTAPVAIYVLCVQAAQPIHGVCAAIFNFLLPHMSSRREIGELQGSRRVFRVAAWANFIAATALALPLILWGRSILALWIGPQFAVQGRGSLGILAMAYALLALNVVPHYSLLAMGDVRYVSGLNLLGGALSLCAAVVLIPRLGLIGAALARLLYGSVTAFLMLRVRRALSRPIAICEGVVPLSS